MTLLTFLFCQCLFSPSFSAYAKEQNQDHTLGAYLWMEKSAEYEALALQAFNLATLQLDKYIADHKGDRPIAIVTDIDETVLLNLPETAFDILNEASFTQKRFTQWARLEKAKPVPGAVEFFKSLPAKKVTPIYISNRLHDEDRKSDELKATTANLRKLGFPVKDYKKQVLLRECTKIKGQENPDCNSIKTSRREKIGQEYDIALYLGDNLADFHEDFDSGDSEARGKKAQANHEKWGHEWIVLPNPVYGTWAKALQEDSKATPGVKLVLSRADDESIKLDDEKKPILVPEIAETPVEGYRFLIKKGYVPPLAK